MELFCTKEKLRTDTQARHTPSIMRRAFLILARIDSSFIITFVWIAAGKIRARRQLSRAPNKQGTV